MNDGKQKTHFRKVYKSDHLGSADLEDMIEANHNLIFTIAYVRQEWGATVAGRKGNFNIAYFKEGIKPLVLNATNSKVVKQFAGGSPFVEDWKDIPIQLYIDPNVKMKGEVVGGVRIRPQRPKLSKPELLPGTDSWGHAIAAFKRDGNLSAVESRMVISPENKEALIQEANNG